MPSPEKPIIGFQSSRRNLMRMGAVAASALIAKATTAAADDFDRDRDRNRNGDWWRDRDRHRDRDHDRDDHHCFLKGTTI